MKFLVPNYGCLQEPLTKGLPPPDPCPLCPLSSTEFVEPPPKKKFLGTLLLGSFIDGCQILKELAAFILRAEEPQISYQAS